MLIKLVQELGTPRGVRKWCMAIGAVLVIAGVASGVCTRNFNWVITIIGLLLMLISYEIQDRWGLVDEDDE